MTKQLFTCAASCSVLMLSVIANAVAQDEEEGSSIFPVEVYTCNFDDGHGTADLDQWVVKWNAWVDEMPDTAYSAYTLKSFYYGPDQDFDIIWLGLSPDGASMGRAHDAWLHDSGDLPAELSAFMSCAVHSNYATMVIKEPPDDDDASPFVLGFSDCKIAEGKSFMDVEPALKAWGEYRTGHGSEAGMWVMFPAYGGGDADFDFKFVVSHPSLESQGVDYDQYGKEGYAKSMELFAGLLECDDARVYSATQVRDGIPDAE